MDHPIQSSIERVSPEQVVLERERTRAQMLEELAWTHGVVDLDALTTTQVGTILGWVRQQLLFRGGHCDLPGNSFIARERRRGSTKRWGWRFVVYVGALGSEQEIAVCVLRGYALDVRRRHHALWWYDQVRPRSKEGA